MTIEYIEKYSYIVIELGYRLGAIRRDFFNFPLQILNPTFF